MITSNLTNFKTIWPPAITSSPKALTPSLDPSLKAAPYKYLTEPARQLGFNRENPFENSVWALTIDTIIPWWWWWWWWWQICWQESCIGLAMEWHGNGKDDQRLRLDPAVGRSKNTAGFWFKRIEMLKNCCRRWYVDIDTMLMARLTNDWSNGELGGRSLHWGFLIDSYNGDQDDRGDDRNMHDQDCWCQ